jgi:hypothetical protein
MDKLEAYLQLYGKLQKFKQLNLQEDFEAQGNLAFFVESYFNPLDWEAAIEKIDTYTENKNVNELCWFLSCTIRQAFVKNHADICFKSYVLIAKLNNSLNLKGYLEGNLNSFKIVDEKYYPAFFMDHMANRCVINSC